MNNGLSLSSNHGRRTLLPLPRHSVFGSRRTHDLISQIGFLEWVVLRRNDASFRYREKRPKWILSRSNSWVQFQDDGACTHTFLHTTQSHTHPAQQVHVTRVCTLLVTKAHQCFFPWISPNSTDSSCFLLRIKFLQPWSSTTFLFTVSESIHHLPSALKESQELRISEDNVSNRNGWKSRRKCYRWLQAQD